MKPDRSVLRFLAAGAGATAVHAGVVLLLTALAGIPQSAANAAAALTATLFSYLANTLWSFGQKVTAANASRFFAVALLGAALAGGVAGAAERAGWSPAAGIAAVVALVTPITYLLHRFWTFGIGARR